jgi:predicted MPP superfamily phosphohydrolase
MKQQKLLIVLICIGFSLFFSTVSATTSLFNNPKQISSDFYFVQLTDTHIMHKMFDPQEQSKTRFSTVINTVLSFENTPAFIVITGDLVEWGGNGWLGALNYKTMLECLYKNNDQLFADAACTIPVYTTPGNHDYCFHRNLRNYHTYIDAHHIDQEDHYSITYEDTSLFFMDSGPNYYADLRILFDWHGQGLTDDDITWLDTELATSSSAHNIILMHHPAVGSFDDVFINNREKFITLCETYDVEVVLTGHTHHSKIYDHTFHDYANVKINCSKYPPLYVQTDDCKQGIHYRNISITDNDVWLEECTEIKNISNPLLSLQETLQENTITVKD